MTRKDITDQIVNDVMRAIAPYVRKAVSDAYACGLSEGKTGVAHRYSDDKEEAYVSILSVVRSVTGYEDLATFGRRGDKKFRAAKWAAAVLLYDANYSTPRIARECGWKDHTTVLYARDEWRKHADVVAIVGCCKVVLEEKTRQNEERAVA